MRKAISLLAVLAATTLGCSRKHQDGAASDHGEGLGTETGHEYELKTAQITVWTNGYELFAEHTPPIAGQDTKFITHVSVLQTGLPRSAGPIKFVFRQGESGFEHPQAAPDRAGIYLPAITFPKEGEWHGTVIVPGETNAMIELPPIRVFPNEEAAVHSKFPDAPEGISFLKEQQWKLQLRSEAMSQRTLVERVSVPAQVRAKPGFSAVVAAPLHGQLAPLSRDAGGMEFPNPGQRVESGDLLAVVRPRFSEAAARYFESQGEFDSATAALKQAEAAYERTKSLVGVQAKSQRDLEEAELALASARARYSAASALHPGAGQNSRTNGPLGGIDLRAPIGGVVTSVSAGIGEPVTPDQPLFTILDPSTIWIEARLPESALARVGAARDAICQFLDGSNRQFPLSAENGRLVFSGLEVDPQTRTVPFIYELSNTNALLRIGQSVRLHVETATALDTLSIPHSALVEEGGLFVVFVQVSGETFQRREVQLGIRDGNWIQILSGVSPDERVVTEGAYAIRLAAASNVIPDHGHTH